MSQAFNLSQFANKVNTSGQADLTTAVTGTLPVANGGTNNGSLAVTAGGVVYTDGTKLVNVGAGTTGQALLSNGASAPTWGTSGLNGYSRVIFASSGSWTVPGGVTRCVVSVIGGGGGGSAGGSAAGGRGGAAIAYVTGLTPGASTTITVGAGGALSTAGGTSSFGAFVSATGGAGGSGGAAGSGTVSTGTALKTGSIVNGNNFNSNQLGHVLISTLGMAVNRDGLALGNPGIAWSTTAIYHPGAPGTSFATAANSTGGVGGVVMIEF